MGHEAEDTSQSFYRDENEILMPWFSFSVKCGILRCFSEEKSHMEVQALGENWEILRAKHVFSY